MFETQRIFWTLGLYLQQPPRNKNLAVCGRHLTCSLDLTRPSSTQHHSTNSYPQFSIRFNNHHSCQWPSRWPKTWSQTFVVINGSEDYHLAAQDVAWNFMLLSEREFGLSYFDMTAIPLQLTSMPFGLHSWSNSVTSYISKLICRGSLNPTIYYGIFNW
jgi:hypothetical protein